MSAISSPAASTPAPAAKPITELLNPDGTLNLTTGYSGTIDLAGFRMEADSAGAPRFVSDPVESEAATISARSHAGNPDEPWDRRFTGPPGVNYSVSSLAIIGSDLYVGGQFDTAGDVAANSIARWDGVSWSTLGVSPNDGVDGWVHSLAAVGTDLYVGGAFSTAGGVPANNIARWDGTAWSALGVSPDDGVVDQSYFGGVFSITAIGSDLYVGGGFLTAGGLPVNNIAKWDGASWSALGVSPDDGTDDFVISLAVVGTNLYAGGYFSMAGGVPARGIARWDGVAWSALGVSPNDGVDRAVRSLAAIGTNLWVGGEFSTAGGLPANNVAKWDGFSWSALGVSPNDGVRGRVFSLVAAGTDLYVAGEFSTAGGAPANDLARWNGITWSALGASPDDGVSGDTNGTVSGVRALAMAGTGLYAGGNFTRAGGEMANNVAEWDGASWNALGVSSNKGLNGSVQSLAVMGTSLYAGGTFRIAGGVPAKGIARWDGVSWSTLGVSPNDGVDGWVLSMAAAGTDLYVGGYFNAAGGAPANNIAKWDGMSWSTLGASPNDGVNGAIVRTVYSLAVIGSDLYVGGQFTAAGGAPANNIAKWDGSSWSTLGVSPNDGVNDALFRTVYSLAVIGSDLYVGGQFTAAGGAPANNIAKWDGSSWSTLGVSPNDGVRVAIVPRVRSLAAIGTDLYAGGDFAVAGGSRADDIAKWDGSAWSSLGVEANNGVTGYLVAALAAVGTDLYVGGWDISAAGGAPANNIAKWDGSSWSTLGSNSNDGVNGAVWSLAAIGNHLYLGGSFTAAGGIASERIASYRMTNCGQDGCSDICRPSAFYGKRGAGDANLTQSLIDTVLGGLRVCGQTITSTSNLTAPHLEGLGLSSALEGLCVRPKRTAERRLYRELVTARLNCVMSGGESCDAMVEPFIDVSLSECDALCRGSVAPGTDYPAAIDACTEQLACFNRGGRIVRGECAYGKCSVTNEPCGGDSGACPPIVVGTFPTLQECQRFPGNCRDAEFCQPAVGICPDDLRASSAAACKEARANSCAIDSCD